MGRNIDLDDLLDTTAVASLLGLASATSVSTYRSRYDDFPEPAWTGVGGRCQAWVRGDIEAWTRARRGD